MTEVLDHSPADLTPADRLLLLAIAEKANDVTRQGFPGWEVLTHRMGWAGNKDGGRNALSNALGRLADRGLDVRVPVATGKDGRLVYAARGHRTTYRIPLLRRPGEPERVVQDATLSERVGGDPTLSGATSEDVPERVAQDPTLQRVAQDPTQSEKGWQSLGEKGGNPYVERVVQDATPTLIEPSLNPQAKPEEPPPLPRYGEDPEVLREPLRTIMLSLLATDPAVTLDEARAVGQLVAKLRGPKSVTYYTKIAEGGGYGGYLGDVRKSRGTETEKILTAARRTQPACEHGEAAGRFLHPTHKVPLCPYCRRGAPPLIENDRGTTDPDLSAVITAYRDASDGLTTVQQFVEIAGQAKRMLKAGATVDQLITLAQSAAPRCLDLLTAARRPEGKAA
jgi:hypothetical protein